jgi:hypothetical protein
MNRITTRIFNTQKQNIRVVLVDFLTMNLKLFFKPKVSNIPYIPIALVINDIIIPKTIHY